jgi:hypothetical protein
MIFSRFFCLFRLNSGRESRELKCVPIFLSEYFIILPNYCFIVFNFRYQNLRIGSNEIKCLFCFGGAGVVVFGGGVFYHHLIKKQKK